LIDTTVDIVLPCYNPNENWHAELLKFNDFVKGKFDANYIVVNDGSKSKSLQNQINILIEHQIKVQFISYDTNMGKGFALRKGVSSASSDFIVYTDIDFPFKNESTLRVIQTLCVGQCDVVAGYRSEEYYQNKMSGFRKLLSKSFRFFIKDILNLPISDTQCGLKGFNKTGRELFLKTTINRYLFDFEFIYRSCKNKNIRVLTVPAELKDNVIFSRMKIKILVQETFNLISVLLFRRS